ncbi:hypothetical protein SAMN04487943_102494 [Gracilibacillus orientalis]|uniref:Uncharacterized protein n=1 Tax=Gracilibacillus orientalis TaxID=334253 RepID=A0A1I4J7K5_9BACI|nr:hypothetical protein [Gracilibacillus orientalis]SFL62217.1 hypothetical protein SAMN04487943_102494 [Gracilibacillus orientalis]
MTSHTHFHKPSKIDDFIQRFFYDRYDAFRDEVIFAPKRFSYEIDTDLIWDFYEMGPDVRVDIVRNSLRLSRIEPENSYLFHTNAPSARGINSNTVLYVEVENFRLTASVYHQESDQFIVIYNGPTNNNERLNEFWILYNKSNIGRIYGDFGYILSLLDAGHFINQTSFISSLHNETVLIQYDDINDLGLNLTNHEFHILAKVTLSPSLESASQQILTKEHQQNLCKFTVHHDVPFQENPLNNYLQLLFKGSQIRFSENNTQDCIHYFENIKATMYNRTSSQSPQGFSGFIFENNSKEMNNLIEYISTCLQSLSTQRYFRLLLLNLGAVNNNEGVLISNEGIQEVDLRTFDKNCILQDGHDYLELNGCKYIIFTIIQKELLHQPSGLNYSLIQSAELIHSISLYLTGQVYDTRPMKNINERYLEQVFKLDNSLVSYMLIAGKSHHYNLRLEI